MGYLGILFQVLNRIVSVMLVRIHNCTQSETLLFLFGKVPRLTAVSAPVSVNQGGGNKKCTQCFGGRIFWKAVT